MINTSDKRITTSIKVINALFFITMLVAFSLMIYYITKLPFDNGNYRSISKALGNIGMIISFFPLGGLVIKYLTKLLDRFQESKIVTFTNDVLKMFLFYERKTRLLMAWTAIFLLACHMIIFASMIDSHSYIGKHQNRYSWNAGVIIGTVAIGLLILMNLNGILMLTFKWKKIYLNKIKYIGLTNLVFGISFFVLAIIHISMLG